ncbi:DUF4062 domain-containing protein [Pseudoneobacillus rhizosphaerae]|uniref:DUF4062 domain-containing protein n=1 Tax=Pseudoneobacillus rhizosphaerae TaxID=2880968 RepID=A0A9C7GAR9_9BACI|nr:DUF4062 domain-containing protein [Pseudoneobacillus rhizosphaerae]CAG9609141.1 hypothetical protein NEOCIP111885_02882 [Pseudoneobacillus rhizosphaerae]
MAGLKVFISSTCYDLGIVRSQLRAFLNVTGYEPVMSDYNDILYDPREHTHTSCINEVANCDMLILLIGSRFGGKGVPEAINKIDIDSLMNESKSIESLIKLENLSITQLEVLKAIEQSIPIYTFIDQKVYHDHEFYEKNKSNKDIISRIHFPSIEKQETAEYIFNFINFVRLRTKGNNIFQFNKIQDVEEILKKQWSSYFQRLLNEQRYLEKEARQYESLSQQFEDLKAAILTTIGTSNEKEVARGVVRFRKLVDFLVGIQVSDFSYIKQTKDNWDMILIVAGINKVLDLSKLNNDTHRILRARTILLKEDETFYEVRFHSDFIYDLSLDWDSFIKLSTENRNTIIDTLLEMYNGSTFVKYHNIQIEQWLNTDHDKLIIKDFRAG